VDPGTATPTEVMRAMVAAFNTGEVSDVAAFVHPEYLDHQGLPGQRPITGVDGFVHVVRTARSGYVALSVTIEDLIESLDRTAARIAWSGLRSSGEMTQRETIDIVRVEAGRAIEHWGGQS
jgi:predicted SnoaL-like aldol condensation-catalyzing enzyme